MFWKIYAVVYLVLVAVGLPSTISHLPRISPIELIDAVVFAPVAVAGLWSHAYRHISLPKNAWKVLLFVSVFWRAISLGNTFLFGDGVTRFGKTLSTYTAKMSAVSAVSFYYSGMAIAALLAGLFIVPPIVALYRNAYGNESLLQLMSPSPKPSGQTVA
jgi:hypothetical protein